MSKIEERIVQMTFDNKHFEKNVSDSIKTLDKLEQSLRLEDAAKGFENINKAAQNVSLESIAAGVEAIQDRFSTLGIVGMQMITNLTNAVTSFGRKIINFASNKIINGGISRAMNLEDARFMMQGLLKDDKKVAAVMNDVGESVTDTAYSLDAAAKVAAQFTATGIEAGEEMLSALRGVTGTAAMTKSEYEGIGQIFTTVAGNGRLMGDQLRQLSSRGLNAAATLAEYLTKIGDGTEVTESKVREMVSKGQISFKTFAAAMDDAFGEHAKKANDTFTGSFANVGASLSKIGAKFITPLIEQNGPLVDFFNVLKDRINEVNADLDPLVDTFVNFTTNIAKNATKSLENTDMIGNLKVFSNVFSGIRNIFKGFVSILTPIKDAFRDIFPKKGVEQLLKISESFKSLTSKFKLSEESTNNLKNTFKGLFSVLDIFKNLFSSIWSGLSPGLSILPKIGAGVLKLTGTFGEWLTKLNEIIKTSDVFNNVVSTIITYAKKAVDALKFIFDISKEKISSFPFFEALHSLLGRLQTRLGQVGDAFGGFKTATVVILEGLFKAVSNSPIISIFKNVWSFVKKITSALLSLVGDFAKNFATQLSSGNFKGIFDLINSISIGGIAIGISKFLKSTTKSFDGVRGILDGVTGILDGVRGSLEAFQTQLKAGTLLKIAGAIAILSASIILISLIDSDKLATSLGAITVLFADLMASMAVFEKIGGSKKNVMKSTTAMIGMAVAINILATAMVKLSDLSWEGLAKGIIGIASLSAIVVASAHLMSTNSKKMIKGSVGLVIFAGAVKILAGIATSLGQLSWSELTRGLVGVGILLTEISLFLNTAKFGKKAISTATGIVIISAAIKILSSSVESLGAMSWENLAKGLAGIGVLLTEIMLFTKLSGSATHIISTGISLIAIGAAMKILASAMNDFGSMSWENLARGLVAMAGALLLITTALNFMPKNMIGIGAGLILVSTSLLIMASSLSKLSSLSWEDLGKGLIAMAGGLGIFAIALNLMKGTLGAAAALLIATGALVLLVPVLSIVGAMSWTSIAKGLIALGGAFAIIGVAGLLLKPLVPTLLALAGVFVLFGVGVVAVGIGLVAIGAGLSAIAIGFGALVTSIAGGATAIVAALTVIIIGVANLIPALASKIGEGIVAVAVAIGDGAGAIGKAISAVLKALIDVFVDSIPAIADGALRLVVGVLEALVAYTPTIIENVMNFLILVINGVAEKLPELIEAVVNLFMALFKGVVSALNKIDPEILIKGILGIGFITAMMVALSFIAGLIPGALLGVLGFGLVIAELALVLAAVGSLAKIPGLMDLVKSGGKLLEQIGVAIGSFIGGIIGGVLGGITGQLPKIGTDLSMFMANVTPFIEGASKIDASMMSGVKALAETILLLTAANVIDGLSSWFTGGSSLTKFGEELAAFGPYFNQYYDSIKHMDVGVIEASSNAAKALGEMAANLPNSGGVAGWFAGENSLAVFGEELAAFGPHFKAYADSVKGLDAQVVSNSADAAIVLSDMASNLPNQGGVSSWFAGDNTLSMFAEGLAAFGPHFKAYADSVAGMDTNVVSNSAAAAATLSEFASNLPNQGGVSSWFAGDNTLASFGTQLVLFGRSFSEYASSVAHINTSQLSDVITETIRLADMISTISKVDNNGLSGFGAGLRSLGFEGVDSFIGAFNDSELKIQSAAKNMIDVFIKAAKSKEKELVKALTKIVDAAIKDLNKDLTTIRTLGNNMIVELSRGVSSETEQFVESWAHLINTTLERVRLKYNDFKLLGGYFVSGVALGIKENTQKAVNESIAMANAASKGAADALEEKSPSKVGYRIGDFFGIGFVSGIHEYVTRSEREGALIANATVDGMRNVIGDVTDLFDVERPTISPVIDLSDAKNGANELYNLFNDREIQSVAKLISGNQNGNNIDIISAISELKEAIQSFEPDAPVVINGITYDDGSAVSNAVKGLIRAARIERRV